MVFQSGALFDSLTVGENIAFPLEEHNGETADQIEARVLELAKWWRSRTSWTGCRRN